MNLQHVSVFAALAAVVLSPLISIFTVRTQMRMTVLAGNRQKWLDDLRSVLSEYCGLMHVINQARSTGGLDREHLHARSQRAFELESQITLMLNPNEVKHTRLIDLTAKARSAIFCDEAQFTPEAWEEIWHSLMAVAKGILKEEWSRVKALQ